MKQTPIYYSMLAAFAFFCATGCSNDAIDNTPQQPDDPAGGNTNVKIHFTASLGTETRTSYESDGKTPEGFIVKWKGHDDNQDSYDKVGILVGNSNNTSVSGAKNIPYRPKTSDASSSLEADGTPLSGLEKDETYNFYSYYPYVENQNINLSNVTVPNLKEQTQSAPDNNEHIGKYDFMYAKEENVTIEESNNPPTIDFQYKHLFTSLQFKLKNGRSTAVKINKITLERQDGSKILIPNYYSFQIGQVRSTTNSDSQQLTVTAPADLSANTTHKFWMMLYPKSIGDATDLKISVYLSDNNGKYLYTLKKAVPANGFETGCNYTVEMEVKDTHLTANESWTTLIGDLAALKAFRDKVNNGTTYAGQTVLLTSHIDFANNETWTPIGNGSNGFQGTFDGGGYHISNLKVDMTNTSYVGLFGYVKDGTVRNLRVSGNVTSTGTGLNALYVGGIVGYSDGSTVENCIFKGDVSGNNNVGGIVGRGSTITGCYTKGKVVATGQNAGGIVGTGNATDCYSAATIEGDNIGGIIGQNDKGETATHCYATSTISGPSQNGGIIGNNSGSITNCIALTPSITRTGNKTSFGRIAGYVNSGEGATITNCAAFKGMTLPNDITVSADANGKDGASLTVAQCLTKNTYTTHGFSAENGWVFDSNTTWQYLPWNKAFESFHDITADDYRISVPDHLKSTTP